MADINLQEIHDELISVAYEAGVMILAANPGSIDTDTKLNCTLPPPRAPRATVSRLYEAN